MNNNSNIRTWFSKNGLTLLIWLVGLGFLAINWYKVMATDSAVMDRRVTALEQYIDKNDPLVSRFYVLEQKTYNVEDDITEIKERLARMETKLDNLANRQASAKSSQPLAQAKPTPAPQTVSYSYTSYNDTPTADQSAQTKQGEKKDKDSEEAPTPPTVLGTLKKIVGL